MHSLFGWMGTILLGGSAIPQSYHCFRTKTAEGLSWTFLAMWFFGALAMIAYVVPIMDVPLIVNYTINVISLLVILFYKIKDTLK